MVRSKKKHDKTKQRKIEGFEIMDGRKKVGQRTRLRTMDIWKVYWKYGNKSVSKRRRKGNKMI